MCGLKGVESDRNMKEFDALNSVLKTETSISILNELDCLTTKINGSGHIHEMEAAKQIIAAYGKREEYLFAQN